MDKLVIEGGHRLKGRVAVSGSKNSSLPILAATLLTGERCVIRRVPDVSDTNYMLQILRSLGAHVERASGRVIVEAGDISPEAPYDLVRKMRASICVMGPLLGRLGEARVSLPGGCVIGDRPVDLHLKGLQQLGTEVDVDGGNMDLKASKGRLEGQEVNLRGKHGPTVLGTDNVMMAAVLAKGVTVIEGAAAEPEVLDLANFLNAMGAKIRGAGTRRIEIEGVEKLNGVDYEVIPDRIEAGTFLVAGAMMGDLDEGIKVERLCVDHVASVSEVLSRMGHELEIGEEDIVVRPGKRPKGDELSTEPYPGFPTDMQAQMTAMFCVTPGISVVQDTVFPQRFMHVAELTRMGANIHLDGGTAVIRGVEKLSPAPVMASDLRASAALLLAGLCAEGSTTVHRLYHIDRGYEHIDEKFRWLGGVMKRVRDE